MGHGDRISISVELHHQTDAAILVSDDGVKANAVWLPKSQIEWEDNGKAIIEVELPEWLASDKGLI